VADTDRLRTQDVYFIIEEKTVAEKDFCSDGGAPHEFFLLWL